LSSLTKPQIGANNDDMDRQILAIVIQEGGKLLSEVLRNRPRKYTVETTEPAEQAPSEITQEKTEGTQGKASEIATGCVPCAIGHFGTCSGLLNEAMRFAKSEGIESSEVIDRVNMCLDELNSMERVDLRPEMIAELPEWEKELANRAKQGNETRLRGHFRYRSIRKGSS